MTRAQTEVFVGGLISVPFAALCIRTLFQLFSGVGAIDESRAIALFLLSPAFALLIGIGWIAAERFFTARIDGSKGDVGSRMDINQRYLTNTLHGHRTGLLGDPFGYAWFASSRAEEVSAEEMQRRWDAMVTTQREE